MIALTLVAALLLALAVDIWLGEPPVRWHPVVWMGNYLGWAGRRIAPETAAAGSDYKSFSLGALMWSAGVATIYVAAWFVQKTILQLPDVLGAWPGGLLAVLLLGLLLMRRRSRPLRDL